MWITMNYNNNSNKEHHEYLIKSNFFSPPKSSITVKWFTLPVLMFDSASSSGMVILSIDTKSPAPGAHLKYL